MTKFESIFTGISLIALTIAAISENFHQNNL